MKNFISKCVIFLSCIAGVYVGGWLMFIKPILNCCTMFDTGTLTGYIVGITILKCIFATTVGVFIAWAGTMIGIIIAAI